MFISTAYATSATAAPAAVSQGFDPLSLAPILMMGVLFYFLIMRPEQKKRKAAQEMISAVKRGDRVLTSGGILGVVTNVVSEQELEVEIATGVSIKIVRHAVVDVVTKTGSATVTPMKSASTKKAAKKKGE